MTEPVRILVVDDEPDTVGLIELTIQTAGFRVESAFSGQDALDMIREKTFDLILLDVMMPDLSGFDVFTTLKDEMDPPPPVVFLTAKGKKEEKETGQALGAAGYLVKPATRGQLLDAIQAALYEADVSS